MKSFFSPSPEKDDKHHFLKKNLIAFGPVLIAAITLLTANYKIPNWAFYIITTYLVIVLVIYSISPFSKLCKKLSKKIKERRLAVKFYPQLKNTFDDFKSRTAAQDIIAFLNVIISWPEFILSREVIEKYGDLTIFDKENISLHIETIKKCIESVEENLDAVKSKDFKFLADLCGSLVSQYNRIFIKIYNQLNIFVGRGGISSDRLRNLKIMWSQLRENHNTFISRWEGIAKEINSAHAYKVCLDYYEKLNVIV